MSIEDDIATKQFRVPNDSAQQYSRHNRSTLAGDEMQAHLNGLNANDFDRVPGPDGLHIRARALAQFSRYDLRIGVRTDDALSFMAHSATIDNYTTEFLYIPSARDYIPPGCVGRIIHFPHGTQKHEVIWEAPPGLAQPAAGNGTAAFITYFEKELAPGAGMQITGAL